MIVRLTDSQHALLCTWGESQGAASAEEACRLLLAMLLECTGEPASTKALPTLTTRPQRWNGIRVYRHSVQIPPYQRSRKTRALWSWGARQGHQNISASLRALVDQLGELWDLELPNDKNLQTFLATFAVAA